MMAVDTFMKIMAFRYMPADEWEAHGGFDNTTDDDPEYDGTGLGEDDPDDYMSEAEE